MVSSSWGGLVSAYPQPRHARLAKSTQLLCQLLRLWTCVAASSDAHVASAQPPNAENDPAWWMSVVNFSSVFTAATERRLPEPWLEVIPHATLGCPYQTTGWSLPAKKFNPSTGVDIGAGAHMPWIGSVGNDEQRCLNEPGHGCATVWSAAGEHCVWRGGAQVAKRWCGPWDDCGGFYCGTALDVPGSDADWCWYPWTLKSF